MPPQPRTNTRGRRHTPRHEQGSASTHEYGASPAHTRWQPNLTAAEPDQEDDHHEPRELVQDEDKQVAEE